MNTPMPTHNEIRENIIRININTNTNKILVSLRNFNDKDNCEVIGYEDKLSCLLTCLFCEQEGDTDEEKLEHLYKDSRFKHVQTAILHYTSHKIEVINTKQAGIRQNNVLLLNILNFDSEDAVLNFLFCRNFTITFHDDGGIQF